MPMRVKEICQFKSKLTKSTNIMLSFGKWELLVLNFQIGSYKVLSRRNTDFKGLRIGVFPSGPWMGYRQTIDPLSCAATFSHNQPLPLTPGVLYNIIIAEECHDLEEVKKFHLWVWIHTVQYHRHEPCGAAEPLKRGRSRSRCAVSVKYTPDFENMLPKKKNVQYFINNFILIRCWNDNILVILH